MVDRQIGVVMLQVLLADISDIAVFVVFCEQVIKRLLPFRAHRLGNGFPPFFGIREFGIDIENDAPEWKQTVRSEEHTSELQSLMRISYAVFCLKKKKKQKKNKTY